MAKTSVLFEHSQRYMREVMAERLRAEGFVSYKGEDIHWYRLVNNEVVQAIYFITRHTSVDSTFEFRYGCHPLYIPPIFQRSPYMYGDCFYEQMSDTVPEQVPGSTMLGYHKLLLVGGWNTWYRSPDIMITCPRDKNRGRDILELMFPVMDTTKDPYACYEMHKNRRASEIEHGSDITMTPYFVDEVLFWDDQDLIPYCRKYLDRMMHRIAYLQESGDRFSKSERRELEHCKVLDTVLREGGRQEYLQTLQQREQETLRLLKKNCNIP